MATRWNGEMACLGDVPYTQLAPGNDGSDELKLHTLQCWGGKKKVTFLYNWKKKTLWGEGRIRNIGGFCK